MKFKAVIYDMDGLLVDSMIHWIKMDQNFFAQFGIELTNDMIRYMTGRSEEENIRWVKETYNIHYSYDDLLKTRTAQVDDIYQIDTDEMPGASALIDAIQKKGLKQAIASGARHRWIETVVRRFNWHEHIDHMISVEHVEHRGKPEPDVFLHTAKIMDIKPEHCVVFEDAENGVVAAKHAGMACVAVPDERWSFGDFSEADLIVDSLEDKRIYKFLGFID